MGFHVVREGERVAVWNTSGEVQLVDGPRLLFTVLKRVERLRAFYASQFQYLQICYLNGRIENVPGPTTLFFNPIEHTSIAVRDAIQLSAHEVLIVYRRTTDMNEPHNGATQ